MRAVVLFDTPASTPLHPCRRGCHIRENANREPAMTPHLELAARISVEIDQPYVVGEIGTGLREMIPIRRGRVDGPLLSGRVLPGGADWCLTRADGLIEIWARYAIETHDGFLVSVLNPGIARQDGNGDFVGRTTPQFEVASGPYAWLREHVFVGTLKTNAAGTDVALSFFRVD